MTSSNLIRHALWGLLLFLRVTVAWAEAIPGQVMPDFNEVRSGSLWLQGSGGHSHYAPLLDTDVEMDITAMLARVTVRQHFSNPGDDWVEGIYVFPLPDDAAVDHMRLRIGDRTIEGEIREKQMAEREYRMAKKAGKRATLLSRQRPNIFTIAVANIAPHEEVLVEIEYQQSVHLNDGNFSVRFPMTITPRYMSGRPLLNNVGGSRRSGTGVEPDTDIVPDASQISPALSRRGDNINPLNIRVDLAPGFELSVLESPYHAIQKQTLGEERYRVMLDSVSHDSNSDFVLRWRAEKSEEPYVSLFTRQWRDDYYSLLMLAPPAQSVSGKGLSRDVVFLVDTSGSMGGEPLRQAKEALMQAIERLQSRDRFNLIEFNSHTYRLFNEVREADRANKARALSYVRALASRGGTEMASAIDAALTQSPGGNRTVGESRVRQVIFLTDGAVGNEDPLLRLIEHKLDNSRLFTVGIGSAPNTWFMRKAAEFGRGSYTSIGNLTEVREQMSALFRKLETPVLSNLQLIMPDNEAAEVYPERLPDLYQGEPLVVALKTAEIPGHLIVSGEQDEQAFSRGLNVESAADRKGVNVLWARRKLDQLMDRYRLADNADEKNRVKTAVTKVALDHHLVSRFTSLVAVDKTPVRRPSHSLESHALKNNAPKGTRFALPQTATDAELRILVGLVVLLIGFVIYLWDRWHRNRLARL